jgi:Flp pilus assembly protein TadD
MNRPLTRTGFWAGLIVLMTVVAYVPALRAGFIWDDDSYVTENRLLRTPTGLQQIWAEPRASPQYYPLVFTTFWVEYHLWGLHPFGYHAVNVLLHATGAVLLWLILRRLRVPGAWLAAAVFAVHPVHVESVAWITERKNVLSGVFYLGAMLAYLRTRRPATDFLAKLRAPRAYAVALALFVCALLSKTVACSLPAAILLVLWWKRGRLERRDLLPLIPMFAVGLTLGLTTVWLERHHVGAQGADWSFTAAERVLIAGRALWFYAGKLIWPAKLMFNYPSWKIDAAIGWPWLYPAGAAAALAMLWLLRRRIGTGPLVAALLFAGTLAPALGFVNVYPMRYSFVADHFQYLASISFIALVVAVATTVLRRLQWTAPVAQTPTHTTLRMTLTPLLLSATLLGVLGTLSWHQANAYKNVETLWYDTLAKNPRSWIAHHYTGNFLADRGDIAAAAVHYREAVRLRPDSPESRNKLGCALAEQGKLDEAIGQFREMVRLKPRSTQAHYNLATALVQRGDLDRAIQHFTKALQIRPEDAATHNNLAIALAKQGRLDEAVAHHAEAVRIAPNDPNTHVNLADALLAQGGVEAAIPHYRTALQLDAANVNARFNLAVAFDKLNRPNKAIQQYRAVLELDPQHADARQRLEAALARRAGRPSSP